VYVIECVCVCVCVCMCVCVCARARVYSGATIFERKRGHIPPSYIISEFSPGSMEKLVQILKRISQKYSTCRLLYSK